MHSISKITNNFGKFLRSRGKYNLLDVIKIVVKKFIFRLDRKVITCLLLREPLPVLRSMEEMEIREANLSDVEDLSQLVKENNYSRSEKEFDEWIKKGEFFLLAVSEGKIIGYCCVLKKIPSKYRNIGDIKFKNNDAWGKDAFIHPQYRGTNVYPVLAIEVLKSAAAARFQRVFGAITCNNFSSRSSHQKLGCKEIKEISLCKILFYKRLKIKSLTEKGKYA